MKHLHIHSSLVVVAWWSQMRAPRTQIMPAARLLSVHGNPHIVSANTELTADSKPQRDRVPRRIPAVSSQIKIRGATYHESIWTKVWLRHSYRNAAVWHDVLDSAPTPPDQASIRRAREL